MLLRLPMRSPPSDRAPYSLRTVNPWRIAAGNRRRYARKKNAAWLRPTGRTGSAPLNGKTGPLGEPDAESGAIPSGNGGASGSGSSDDDVWLTLGHTASMSPDERARRGVTPPEAQAQGAEALEREALASTGAAPLMSAASSEAARAAATLPVEDSSRYELEGVHARGGLGRVVRAHDRLLRRTVAIKELLQRTPSAQARFMREALITARLQHPGIVPVHEAGRWPSGDPYYSMKLVSGRTLKELIQERTSLDERMALLPHVLAVAEAIAYAHSQGVIHRDIKPANVVVGDFGEAVVVDWGLAKDLSGSAERDATGDEAAQETTDTGAGPTATAVGHIMGTPSYMAPEQARGENIDARADVYSLGALLYELLAGEPPHTGDSADKILLSALASAPVPIELRQPGAPPDLVAIVHKAMARRAADRYRSAIELAEDVRRFQTGQLVTARQYSTRTLVRRWIARHRGVVAVAAAAAVALAITGAVAFQRVVAQRNQAEARRGEAMAAEHKAREKQNELIFLQAQSWLARDPTAALAWLKQYPPGGQFADKVGAMVDEAIDRGVARHILRQPTWPEWVGFSREGSTLFGVLRSGEVLSWDVDGGEPRRLGRHSDNVKVVAMSPDKRILALGGVGGAIELFDLENGAAPRRLPSHVDAVRMLGFSADGKRLLSVSADRAIRVWDLTPGGEPAPSPLLAIDGELVKTAALSPTGKSVIFSTPSGGIYRVDVATQARLKLAHLDKAPYALAPAPDEKKIAAQYGEMGRGTVVLIDAASGEVEELGIPSGKGNWGFSPSGKLLATAGADGTIHIHEMESGNDRALPGHEDAIYKMVFSRDESTLVSASDDQTARVWDLRTGSYRVLRGHDDDVYNAALSPDGSVVATASFDSSIRLWDLGGSQELSTVLGRVDDLDDSWSILTTDGDMVLTGTEDAGYSWDLATGERRGMRYDWPGKVDPKYFYIAVPVLDLAGRRHVLPQEGGVLEVWNLDTGEKVAVGGEEFGIPTALALSSKARTLVSASDDGRVLVWDLRAGEEGEPRVLVRDRRARGAALSNDGSKLALWLENRIELIDMTSGAVADTLDMDPIRTASRQPRQLRFSPDGTALAAWSQPSASVVLWNIQGGRVARVDLVGHEAIGAVFAPDSSRLAVPVGDRTVRVIDVDSGQTRLLRGHGDMVYDVAWSPDSRMLASASYDRTIRLWNPDTERVRVLRAHSRSVSSVAFSLDGATLTSVSADRTVRRWNLERLPDVRAEAVPLRLAAATTAVIGAAERAESLEPGRAAARAPAR